MRLTTVATHVEIEKEQAEPYFKMRDDFAALCECAVIWDVKSHQATDKLRERTTAGVKVERQSVTFSLDSCDLIQWEQKVPQLRNSKGGDIFLYPGFILYRAAKQAFSVIDYHDVNGKGTLVQFYEQEGVPRDSKVVGHTWAKANKDGSRDKRFIDNFQIPIALYGAVTFKSESGLWEEFQFSNPDHLQNFLNSLNAFVSSLTKAPSAQQLDKRLALLRSAGLRQRGTERLFLLTRHSFLSAPSTPAHAKAARSGDPGVVRLGNVAGYYQTSRCAGTGVW